MEIWNQASGAGLYVACFCLSIVSALVPWVNGEALLLSFAVWAPSRSAVACLVLLASLGQMAGKCVLYWGGRNSLRLKKGRAAALAATWQNRLGSSPVRACVVVFVSSAVGIPPFYLITLLSGAVHLGFGRFVGIGLCGRLVRFGLLVLIPRIVLSSAAG
jgi:membrane protein YqaA with SNARE-associated domain